MINIIIIFILSYLFVLVEKFLVRDIADVRHILWNIREFKNNKIYAPFKYRVLPLWIFYFLGLHKSKWEAITIGGTRYQYNTYFVNDEGIEKYYFIKCIIIFFISLSFYWYINLLHLNGILGIFLLFFFLVLNIIFENPDLYMEIGFYSLIMVGCILNFSWIYFLIVSCLSSLNRESSIFMIPIVYFYSNVYNFIFTIIGFLIGFIVPRYLYRNPVDNYDNNYYNGFYFLTFNPIGNWTKSIWPHLKKSFKGLEAPFYWTYKNKTTILHINNNPFLLRSKDIIFNRIFLGLGTLILFIIILIMGYINCSEYFNNLILIFSIFIIMISIPGDIREIRIYYPSLIVIIPLILLLWR